MNESGNLEELIGRQSKTIKETHQQLMEIVRLGDALDAELGRMPMVAMSLLHDSGMAIGLDISHYKNVGVRRSLSSLSEAARETATQLLLKHSPTHDPESGANPAFGRDHDHSTIPAGDDETAWLQIRSPKDRFAFYVIAALFEHEDISEKQVRGGRRSRKEFLDLVWSIEIEESNSPSWERILNQQKHIFAFAKRKRRQEEDAKFAFEKDWAGLIKQDPPKTS
ncbi:MAG: hypothetical protein ABJP70_01210 [Erythrobacter sp.]